MSVGTFGPTGSSDRIKQKEILAFKTNAFEIMFWFDIKCSSKLRYISFLFFVLQ